MIWDAAAGIAARASPAELFCEPAGDGFADNLIGRGGTGWMVFDDG